MANNEIFTIVDTRANLISNLQSQMRGIETDNNRDWVYKDDDGYYHISAQQRFTTDGGSTWIYPTNVFGNLQVQSTYKIQTPTIRALDSNGLAIGDDSGLGISIADGGAISIDVCSAAGGSYSDNEILVRDSGVIKYITVAELASYLTFPGTENYVQKLDGSGNLVDSTIIDDGSTVDIEKFTFDLDYMYRSDDDTDFFWLSGGDARSTGGGVLLYGSTSATNPNRIAFYNDSNAYASFQPSGKFSTSQSVFRLIGTNIRTESQYISYDGNNEGLSFDSSNNATFTGTLNVLGDNDSSSGIKFVTTGGDPIIQGNNTSATLRLYPTSNTAVGGNLALSPTDGVLAFQSSGGSVAVDTDSVDLKVGSDTIADATANYFRVREKLYTGGNFITYDNIDSEGLQINDNGLAELWGWTTSTDARVNCLTLVSNYNGVSPIEAGFGPALVFRSDDDTYGSETLAGLIHVKSVIDGEYNMEFIRTDNEVEKIALTLAKDESFFTLNGTSGSEKFAIRNSSDVEVFSIDSEGYMNKKGTFAEIYLNDGSTAQSIANGAAYSKITLFGSNGESSNCTANATSDKITITKTGRYFVNFSISFTGATNNINWYIAAFLNGTEQDNIHARRKIATGGDYGSASGCGFIDVTSASLDLDLRVRHDDTGSSNMTPIYMNLSCIYVGET